ncbi:hypothetical protein [Ideonella livida]|uniref:Uncharacterized protein n=1 Tax=Ideonella livida TaxID=2707176 RepID=A0A7C9PF87_9BURK|nr:hypothetical protein [Ideonella livida]NDY89932.1 hypothetical protein [Ideonella livida]
MSPLKPLTSPALLPALLLGLALVAPAAQAQGKTGTLGGQPPAAGGKIMTKDELRACLGQQDGLTQRRKALEEAIARHNQVREPLDRQREALAGERAAVEQVMQALRSLRAQEAEHDARQRDWQQRLARLDTNPDGLSRGQIERQRAQLEQERLALNKARHDWASDYERRAGEADAQVAQFNQRSQGLDPQFSAWNATKAQLDQQSQDLDLDREEWRLSCGSRRFREDDEKALRAGK